ncbi:hypothetical protein QTP88_024334 [Uroleucon formosanum]
MASEAIFRVAEPQNGIVKCVGGDGENKRGDTNRNQRASAAAPCPARERTVLQGQLAIRRSYTVAGPPAHRCREFLPFRMRRDVSPPPRRI